MALYKVTLNVPWGITIGYWYLTKAEVRTFERKGAVMPMTADEVKQDKCEIALAEQRKQIDENQNTPPDH